MRLGILLLLVLPVDASSVSGTVANAATGSPVKKANIALRGPQGSWNAVSDANGRFEVSGLPPNDYIVILDCQGFLPVTPIGTTSLRVTDAPLTGVRLLLSPLASISGRVLDEEGEPVVAQQVFALRRDYTRPGQSLVNAGSAATDDRGEYRIFDIVPGRYYVQFKPVRQLASSLLPPAMLSLEAYPMRFYPDTFDPLQAAPITLTPGADIGRIDFEVHKVRLFRISGTAMGEGRPVLGVVVATACGAAAPTYSSSVRTDGTFDLSGVQPGTYCLSVSQVRGPHSLFAFRTVQVSDRDVEGIALAASPGVEVAGKAWLDGAPPQQPATIRISLEPLEHGDLGVTKFLQPDGSFSFPDLVPGLYSLSMDALPAGIFVKEMRYGDQDVTSGRLTLAVSAPLTVTLARGSGQLQASLQTAGSSTAGIRITVVPAGSLSPRRDLVRNALTSAAGNATFQLPPGDYQVVAWETGEPELVRWDDFRKLLFESAPKFTVSTGGSESVTLKPLSAADVELIRSRLP